jgi:hypothetical protein
MMHLFFSQNFQRKIVENKKDTNPEMMKPTSNRCLGKVNIETPIYEKMKFSARKFKSSNSCFVLFRESEDKLLYV